MIDELSHEDQQAVREKAFKKILSLIDSKIKLADHLGIYPEKLHFWLAQRKGEHRKWLVPEEYAVMLSMMFDGFVTKEEIRPDIVAWGTFPPEKWFGMEYNHDFLFVKHFNKTLKKEQSNPTRPIKNKPGKVPNRTNPPNK